jgi:hypothetical protein
MVERFKVWNRNDAARRVQEAQERQQQMSLKKNL